ncbi:MAG: hypothetical protein JO283_15100 [Bradyrhizobium sp.]|nr:hypothetical protein [Bradyrhizobium sp.]
MRARSKVARALIQLGGDHLMKICNAALTNCGVVQDGHAVKLDLIDDTGTEVSLELSFERAQAIAKTLPTLLTRALQTVTGNASSHFVLRLNRWTVEESDDGTHLLLILAADDGYELCIDIPREACKGLGLVLGSYKGAVTAEDRTATASLKSVN